MSIKIYALRVLLQYNIVGTLFLLHMGYVLLFFLFYRICIKVSLHVLKIVNDTLIRGVVLQYVFKI